MTTDERLDLLVEAVTKLGDKLTEEISKINDRFDGIDNRLDEMQDDINIIKADVKSLKSYVRFNRRTEADIIDYIEGRVDEKLERFKKEFGKSA